jgi:hypothetical protein
VSSGLAGDAPGLAIVSSGLVGDAPMDAPGLAIVSEDSTAAAAITEESPG